MLEISGALASLKAALDLARVGIEARDDAKTKRALSEMAGLMVEANMSALALSERTRLLDLATQRDEQAAPRSAGARSKT